MELFRVCSRCGEEKPHTSFHKRTDAPHASLRSKCIQCVKDIYKNNREKHIENGRLNYLKNKEAYIRRAALWSKNNRQKRREIAKRYESKLTQARRDQWVLRRQRERVASGRHTAQELRELEARQNYLCNICGVDLRTTKKHTDHIMPLALGGTHDILNIQILCASCNVKKGAKHPEEFMRRVNLTIDSAGTRNGIA